MAENEKHTLGFEEIVGMIIRRRALFLIPCAVFFFGAVIAGLFMPKTYETSALVRIKGEKIIDPVVNRMQSMQEMKDDVDTLSKQITSWPKMEQLVAQLKLAPGATSPVEREAFINDLRKRIDVRIRNRNIIEISYQDRRPLVAQLVANTLTQNFIDENARVKKEEARNAIEFLGEQLKIYREKLENSQGNFLLSKISVDLKLAENRQELLRNRMATLQKAIPSQATHEGSPALAQLRMQLNAKESELARLSLDAQEGNPQVAALQKELGLLKRRIELEESNDTVKENISAGNPLYVQTEQELRQVEMEIESLNARRQAIVKDSNISLSGISEKELDSYERSKKVDEDIYQTLLKQMEAAYVSERFQDSDKGDRFTVIEYARLPLIPVKPNPAKIAGVGLLGGLCLGFGLVFLVETVSKSFQTIEQTKEMLALPCLGGISKIVPEAAVPLRGLALLQQQMNAWLEKKEFFSRMKFVPPHVVRKVKDAKIAPSVVIFHEPKSKVAEEFRVLRTNLVHGLEQEKAVTTAVVTSSLRGEGKSTTTANLAVALADSGKKVLLIDCDLRKGVSHELLGVPSSPGLGDVLTGKVAVSRAIAKTEVLNLSLIPFGSRVENPSELLGSPQMKEIIGGLKGSYDMILLDTPPVLHLPDASILSKYVDGVIMVVQAGRVKRQDAVASKQILKQVNANTIGFVLTNMEYYMPRYMYDYYYEY